MPVSNMTFDNLNLMYKDSDGEYKTVKYKGIPIFEDLSQYSNQSNFMDILSTYGTFDVTIPSRYKTMNRKKFKKWFMSCQEGTRNKAEMLCNMIRICNGSISYIDVYNECFLFPSYFNIFSCILYKILKGVTND